MEISLKTKSLQYLAPVCTKNISSEYNFELMPGEMQPDLGRILTLDAVVLLRSKDPQQGRCVVSCSAEIAVTYTDISEKGVYSLNASYPFDISADDAQINSDSLVTATVVCVSSESRNISSRKLLVKLGVLCCVKGFCQREILVPISPDEDVYETKIAVCNARLITTVDEKRFELSSNFSLEGPPAVELMSHNVLIELDDTAVSFDKVIAAGVMNLSVLYRAAGSADLIFAEHREPFKLEIPFISAGSAASCSGQIAITSAYVTNEPGLSGDGKNIGFDIGAVIQYSVDESVDVAYLADMYSISNKVNCTFEKVSISEGLFLAEHEVNLQEDVSVEDGVQQFLSCAAFASTVTASRDESDVYSCTVHLSVMYRNMEGQVCQKKSKLTALVELPKCKASCVTARAGNIVIVPNGTGCMVRLGVVFCALYQKEKWVEIIARADSEQTDSLTATPMLWISRYTPAKTLWDICKQHRVSEHFVRSANMLKESELPEPGTLLLIPKT